MGGSTASHGTLWTVGGCSGTRGLGEDLRVVSGAHVRRCLAGDNLKRRGSRRLVTGTWRSPRQQQSPVETATGTCWADIPVVQTGKAG